jgi:hypothetical protein
MQYKDILYQDRTLYKLKPYKYELKYLSSSNLAIILKQARIMINQANKYNNHESIKLICKEINSLYRIYSVKNATAEKHINLFNQFLLKTVRDNIKEV